MNRMRRACESILICKIIILRQKDLIGSMFFLVIFQKWPKKVLNLSKIKYARFISANVVCIVLTVQFIRPSTFTFITILLM
jgi:hypothetical protein